MSVMPLSSEECDVRRALTKSAKDNKGESVANDPLSNGSYDHEDPAEEQVCSWRGDQVRLVLAPYVGLHGRTYQYRKPRFHQHLSSP